MHCFATNTSDFQTVFIAIWTQYAVWMITGSFGNQQKGWHTLYLITPCVNLPLSFLISFLKAIFCRVPHGSHNNANDCIIFALHLPLACWVDAGLDASQFQLFMAVREHTSLLMAIPKYTLPVWFLSYAQRCQSFINWFIGPSMKEDCWRSLHGD